MQDYFYKNQNLYFKLDNQTQQINKEQQDNSFLFFQIWRNLVIKNKIITSIYIINHNNLCSTTQTIGYARVYEDINSINWMLSYGHIGLLVDKVRRNDRNLIFCIKSLEKIISTINYSNKQQESFIINSESEIEKFYISLIRHYRDYLINYSDHLLPFSVKHNNIISFKLICSLMTTQYSNINNHNNHNNNKNNNKFKQHVTTSPLIASSVPRPISSTFDIYISQNVLDLIYSIGSIQLLEYIKKVKPLVYEKIDHKNSFFQSINNMENAEIGNRIGNYYLFSNKIQLLNFESINNTITNNNNFNNNVNNVNNNHENNKNIFSNIFKIISNNTTNNSNRNNISPSTPIPHISLNKLIRLDTITIQQLSINIPSMFKNYQISEFSQLLNKLSKSELTNTIFKASTKQRLFIFNFILIFEYTKTNQNNEIIKLIQQQLQQQNGADNEDNEKMDNQSIKQIIHYFVNEIIMKFIQFNNNIKFSIIIEYMVHFNNGNIQVNKYIHMNSSCYITIFQIALEYADITLFKYLVKMKETDQNLKEYQEFINNKEQFEIFGCIEKNEQGIEKIKQFISFILEIKPTILLNNSWFIKSLISITDMERNDHLQMIKRFIESNSTSNYLQKDIIIQVIKTCSKLGSSSYELLDYFIGIFNGLGDDEESLSNRDEWYSHSFIRMAIKLKDLNLLHQLFKYYPFSKFGEIGTLQNTKKLIKCAVVNQNYEIVSYLLEKGFKFGSRCYSISYRKGNFKILELLFKNSKLQLYGIGKDADLLKLASDNINLMKYIQQYHHIDYISLKYGELTTTTTTTNQSFKSKEFILLNQISPNYKANDISIVIPKNRVIQLLLNELSVVVSDQLYLYYIQIRSIFETLIVNGNLDCIIVWMEHPLMVQKFKTIFKDDIQILIEKTIQYGFIDILRYLIFDQKLSLPSQVLNVIVIPNLVKHGSISTLDFLYKYSILNSSNNNSGGEENNGGEIIKFKKSHVVIACKFRQIHMIRYIHKRAPHLFNDPKQYIISDNLESNIGGGSNNINGSGGNNNNNIGRIIRSSVSHCNFFNFNDNEITTTQTPQQQPINIINTINNTISNLTGSSSIYNLNSQELNSVIDDINHYFLSLI